MIRPIEDEAQLAAALAEPRAVIYKHSPRCGACVASAQEVAYFAEGHPEVPVYQVDVVSHQRLSDAIGGQLQVRHESPQVILVAAGHAIWSASHWDVRALDLEEHTRRLLTT